MFETTSTTLEWKLSGLKKIFESSKGESKSKAIKSVRFGGGKWVVGVAFVLWKANASSTTVSISRYCSIQTQGLTLALTSASICHARFADTLINRELHL